MSKRIIPVIIRKHLWKHFQTKSGNEINKNMNMNIYIRQLNTIHYRHRYYRYSYSNKFKFIRTYSASSSTTSSNNNETKIVQSNKQYNEDDEEEAKRDVEEIEQDILKIIQVNIRPTLVADGGDCEFRGFENGVVKLKLKGACASCQSSTITMRFIIKRCLTHLIPEVKDVKQVSDEDDIVGKSESLNWTG